jgi:hypothetical protein
MKEPDVGGGVWNVPYWRQQIAAAQWSEVSCLQPLEPRKHGHSWAIEIIRLAVESDTARYRGTEEILFPVKWGRTVVFIVRVNFTAGYSTAYWMRYWSASQFRLFSLTVSNHLFCVLPERTIAFLPQFRMASKRRRRLQRSHSRKSFPPLLTVYIRGYFEAKLVTT